MTDIAIRVENLSKRYRIGLKEEMSDTLFGTLKTWLKLPISNFRQLRRLSHFNENGHDPQDVIWALKDVSFEVKRGEVIGIIGRNGAGKSTLLKILSRITEPTHGQVVIAGRVSSLLEVGTGFHPELTGRENIYLNGTVLGMSKAEVDRKFDEIVDFSGVEKFIDTPVKRYSSGMTVRLAFSVAAHLEPEVLLVDEVLAVGDAEFQKKCLGKMDDVAKGGRTVLFVSHQMAAIESLCQWGIVLRDGRKVFAGTQTEAITQYLANLSNQKISLQNRPDRQGSGEVRVVAIELRDIDGTVIDMATSGQALDVYLYFEATPNFDNDRVIASILVRTQLDVPVFLQHNRLTRNSFGALPRKGVFVCRLHKLPLPASAYHVDYSLIVDGQYLDALDSAITLNVTTGDFFGSGETPPISHGVCLVEGEWRMEPC